MTAPCKILGNPRMFGSEDDANLFLMARNHGRVHHVAC
jgi:hypothetical protein